MLCQPRVELPFDVGRFLRLRREAADVAAALQVASLLEQLQVQALEELTFLGEPTTTEPGEHARAIAASLGRDAAEGENSPRLTRAHSGSNRLGCAPAVPDQRARYCFMRSFFTVLVELM